MAATQQVEWVAWHFKRNAAEKKRSKAAQRRSSADQHMIHLCEKYGSFINACKAMDYFKGPTKTKLKNFGL